MFPSVQVAGVMMLRPSLRRTACEVTHVAKFTVFIRQ